jgi:nucleotide-binding universal stress UspA family protein
VYRRILLGTGGSTSALTGMSWLLLGPVSNEVGHHTPHPLLIVHTT